METICHFIERLVVNYGNHLSHGSDLRICDDDDVFTRDYTRTGTWKRKRERRRKREEEEEKVKDNAELLFVFV